MKKRFLLILGLSFLLSSCQCTLVRLLFVKKSAVKHKRVLVKGDQEFIFIPMVHLGKQQYYDEVKEYITKKRSEGYKIYYEGVGISRDSISDEKKDTLERKQRKILGFHLTVYNDKDNQSLPRCVKKYVGQTLTNTGIIPEIDTNADLSTEELIERFETKYGKILLNECDFTTPLKAPYECNKEMSRREFSNINFTYTHLLRDSHLAELLKTTKDKKVVIVFGKKHWIMGGYPTLRDEGFELIEGKI